MLRSLELLVNLGQFWSNKIVLDFARLPLEPVVRGDGDLEADIVLSVSVLFDVELLRYFRELAVLELFLEIPHLIENKNVKK